MIRCRTIWGLVQEAGIDDQTLSSVGGFLSACTLLNETLTDEEIQQRLQQPRPSSSSDAANALQDGGGGGGGGGSAVLEFVLWVAQRRAKRESSDGVQKSKIKRSKSANSTGKLCVDGLRISLLRELFTWVGGSERLEARP